MNADERYQAWLKWMHEQETAARKDSKGILRTIGTQMIRSCHIFYNKPEVDYAIICIPGRSNCGTLFAQQYYKATGIKNAVFVGPTPHGYAWYPMPIDSNNQGAALHGIPRAIKAVEAVQKAIEDKFGITKDKTILTGFSAGGVMAIQAATHSDTPYAGVICHSGAILEPRNLPKCDDENRCPFLLTHNMDDMCFEWYERYMPMKTALVRGGYPTYTFERQNGGHITSLADFRQGSNFMREVCDIKTKSDLDVATFYKEAKKAN